MLYAVVAGLVSVGALSALSVYDGEIADMAIAAAEQIGWASGGS